MAAEKRVNLAARGKRRLVVRRYSSSDHGGASLAPNPIGGEIITGHLDESGFDDGIGDRFHRLLGFRCVRLAVAALVWRNHRKIGGDIENDAAVAPSPSRVPGCTETAWHSAKRGPRATRDPSR